MPEASRGRVLDLTASAPPIRSWWAGVWEHRAVFAMMAKADFQVRYKRATFGVLWAVVLPLLQAAVLAVIFARVINVPNGRAFGAFVLSGVLPFGYFSTTLGAGATAIVDNSGLADKVWFPRALLPLVPAGSNLVSLGVSLVLLVVSLPILGVALRPRLLLLVPGCALLVVCTAALCLLLSALHVYFRDVRFIVQAALLLWFYVTPLAYPVAALGSLRPVIDANPLTGVVTVFRLATVGSDSHWVRSVLISVGFTIITLIAGAEAHRRHDRLFVDLL